MHYKPAEIEPKWQAAWDKEKAFKTSENLEALQGKPKYYILDMFPYPSGAGLHVGHPEGYTATDVLARLKRMQGFAVLHPMGWDSFGLPAERAAMRSNEHPAAITRRNVDNFRRQIKRLGFSYDWDREIATSSPDYYRWTQWIFLKLYEKGLAYLAEVPVNWCPALGTVLANEEVKDGKYVETGDPVERRLMKQWMLKITVYAERLLEDLEGLDWPEGVKEMQRNWIGKSIGAEISFLVDGTKEKLTVFTSRPDTLFGATYCVVAPEHPLLTQIVSAACRAGVDRYVKEVTQKTDLARTDLAKEKTGVFTGGHALHPVTGKPIPIWVADYVLMSYGTGAIMAVPAHDERDYEFAVKYQIPVVPVIQPKEGPMPEGAAFSGDGRLVNSDFLNGLSVEEAQKKMVEWLAREGKGQGRVQYRLRDWLFSRQRYWGEPIPIVHREDGTIVPLTASDLPVELPPVDKYQPTEDGKPPLARAGAAWLDVTLPDGAKAQRETNTMPQWAGSCWYYLRYLDPKNENAPWNPKAEKFWMPVDLYVGGVEHAVLHLLYSRFWHKVLYDCGLVSTKEPFRRLFNQGMILAYSYRDHDGKYYHPSEVEEKEGEWVTKSGGRKVVSQIEKMSKSKLNVVNPDEVIDEYGADAMRLYEMFMGPLEQTKPWQMAGVEGVYRFLHRVWRLAVDERNGELAGRVVDAPGTSEPELWKLLHRTVKKVREDTENMQFNTAISQMMIFVNEATNTKTVPREILKTFLRVLASYAPHLAEELWQRMGETTLIAFASYPSFDLSLCVQDEVTVVLQVNGKKRDEIVVSKTLGKDELEKIALSSEKMLKFMDGKPAKKVIVVPGRLVNVVV